jgi:ferredoxin
MTGTGNSYKVAKWFIEAIDTAKISLCQITEKHIDIGLGNSDLVVFSYPTHGFTAPWLMIKHVFRLPKGNGIPVVVLPTRAGTSVFGCPLPGMEGTAGYLIAFLLWLRGYKVKGVAGVDMPSNWTAVHWGLSQNNVQVIADRGKTKVTKLARDIVAGHNFYSGFIPLVIGLLLARISFMYIIIAQLILSKLFFASNKCNSCSLCQRICPKQAIIMVANRPRWDYSCDSCMACMNYCPQQAIQVSPFTVFLFSYIISLPVAAWIIEKLGYLQDPPTILQFLIQYIYTLISVAFAYWLLHKILRISFVASIWGNLSHTKYFRRYKAPGVSLEDIHKS